MARAFAEWGDVIVAVKARSSDVAWPEGVEVMRFRVRRSRLGNLQYGLKVRWAYLRRRRRIDGIYSRNLLFSLLVPMRHRHPPHGFEFHHLLPGRCAKMYQRAVMRRCHVVVAISDALRVALVRVAPEAAAKLVVHHDAHGEEPGDRPKELPLGRQSVAYAGKILPMKGSALLAALFEQASEFAFHVFTPHPERVAPTPSLVECRYLPHDRLATRLRQMDFLLLPVVPQGTARDYSPYTSPLKLFEYAAAGGVIVGSDVAILREILTHGENAYLVENDAGAWAEALRVLCANSSLYRHLSEGALEVARNSTWRERAHNILARLELLPMPVGLNAVRP